MTTPDGIPLNFIMYAAENSDFSSALEAPKMDIGGRVVLKLAESLLNSNSSIIMDRYFTSIPLLQILLANNIKAAWTLMKSRISFISDRTLMKSRISFISDLALKRAGRGSHDQFVSNDNNVVITKRFDNKPVFLASTEWGFPPPNVCRRWSKTDKQYIHIQRPAVIIITQTWEENVCRRWSKTDKQYIHIQRPAVIIITQTWEE
ncbi:Transposase IS4 [Popillia japonica]|uniref:Transposase IS4 n=1 Tax=Popillia japonica TaxID=7064 RepID=A0AAW1JXX7_POPJA